MDDQDYKQHNGRPGLEAAGWTIRIRSSKIDEQTEATRGADGGNLRLTNPPAPFKSTISQYNVHPGQLWNQ